MIQILIGAAAGFALNHLIGRKAWRRQKEHEKESRRLQEENEGELERLRDEIEQLKEIYGPIGYCPECDILVKLEGQSCEKCGGPLHEL